MILKKRLYERTNILKGAYLSLRKTLARILNGGNPIFGENTTIRGTPRLVLKEDGSLKCTSCRLCETYCPANCIHIESEHSGLPGDEGVPESFRLEILRCISCALCVEACPVDALRTVARPFPPGHGERNWVWDEKQLVGD